MKSAPTAGNSALQPTIGTTSTIGEASQAALVPRPRDDDFTLDDLGFAKACNECRTKLSDQPSLQLRFSSCCGLVSIIECQVGPTSLVFLHDVCIPLPITYIHVHMFTLSNHHHLTGLV